MTQSAYSDAEGIKKRRLLVFTIALGSFMVNLDTYIVNVSMPSIASAFGAPTGAVSWVALAYNLAVVSLLLTFGRLGDKIGLKQLFIAGFAVFTASSLLCGAAPTLGWLIAGRAIQGAGACVLYALTPAMVPKYLPPDERGMAFGLLATSAALGITLGAPLSGIITGLLSWHWVFFINIPVGIMAIYISMKAIPARTSASAQAGEFDFPGAFLSLLLALGFTYGLNRGSESGWASPLILSCFGLSALALAGFIYREKTAPHPLLDLSLFRIRTFNFGNAAMLLAFAFLAGTNFLMPFYLQLVKGLPAAEVGVIYMVYSIIYMLAGPISGKFSKKFRPRTLCTFAMGLASAAIFYFALTLELPGLLHVIVFFALLGAGYAFFISSNNHGVMAMAPAGKEGMVSGTYRMIGRIGMLGGVTLFETVFSAGLGILMAGRADYSLIPRDTLLTGFRNAYLLGGFACLSAMLLSLAADGRKAAPEPSIPAEPE